MARKAKKIRFNEIRLKGMYKIRIGLGEGDAATILSETDWIDNAITMDGKQNYIAGASGSCSGSKQFTYLQLATQTAAFNSTQTSLTGETLARATIATATSTSGATASFSATGSWSSSLNTGTITLGAIGMYNTSSAGTLGCGQIYATSVWNSNQNVSATYVITFS